MAMYSAADGTITVKWTKPTDSDLDHYIFLCTDTTNGGKTVKSIDSVGAATTKETLTATDDGIVEGHEYRFIVYTCNTAGNENRTWVSTSLTPTDELQYAGVTLYRANYTGTNTAAKTHLDTAMTDRSMTVVLNGSNLSKAKALCMKIKGAGNLVVATITNPVSTTDIEIVYQFDALTAEATYSVYPYDNDNGASIVTAWFTVTAPAAVTKVALATAQFGTTKTIGTGQTSAKTLTVLDEAVYNAGDVLFDKTTNKPVAVLYYNTYGSTYCSGTSFTGGWYLPSLAERNLETVITGRRRSTPMSITTRGTSMSPMATWATTTRTTIDTFVLFGLFNVTRSGTSAI